MGTKLQIGGKGTVELTEPTRGMFGENLSGAIEYTLAHWVYSVLVHLGEGVGAFLGGVGVQFLDRVEPSLVKYATPLLDLLLEQKDLESHVRTFLEQLKEPTDAGAAALLGGLASTAGGAMFNSVLNVVTAPLTYGLQKLMRPTHLDPSTAISMGYRGLLESGSVTNTLQELGYPDHVIEALKTQGLKRASISDWYDMYLRGFWDEPTVNAEATRQGVEPTSLDIIKALRQPLLAWNDLLQAMYRGEIGEPEVIAGMGKLGWTKAQVELMLKAYQPLPGLQDVITMAVREAWRDDIADMWGYDADRPEQLTQAIEKLGLDPDWGIRYWRAHWTLPSVTLATEMVHRKIISPSEYETFLATADYPAGWRGKITQAIYSPYTRVDARRMYGLGILDYDGVKKAYMDLGYDDERATNLADFTVLYEADDPETKTTKYRDLSLSMLQQAYYKNLIDLVDFRSQVHDLGYPNEETDLIVALTEATRNVDSADDFTKTYRKDVRSIIERAYYKGTLDAATARSYLVGVGVTEEEITYLLAANDLARAEASRETRIKTIGDAYQARALTYNQAVTLLGQLDLPAAEQANLLSEWSLAVDIGSRRLTEAQYRLAFTKGLIDAEGYREAMGGLGYSAVDVELLVKMTTGEEAS